MATYLPQVTDYIPQIQPWKPNYNFYQNVLERKQSQYDRGWEQTNNIYSSILNAPMMREQNIQRRDNFFKSVENQIQQLSGVDLSLQQNVDSASQIFKPFYEDDNIIHDMSFTKKYQTEMQHAEYLRNCVDKDKCGNKYWEGGVNLMNYIAQDFVSASDDEALKIQAPKYVNYVNFMEKASAAVKEAGFKMEYEAKEGRYMVKRINGPQAVQPLMDFMMARFGDDPELTSFYGAKAALMRYENPEAAINAYEASMLRSKAQTQEEYDQLIKDKANQINFTKGKNVINQTKNNIKAGADRLFLQKEGLEKLIENEGIIEGSDEDKAYRNILEKEKGTIKALENIENISNRINNMTYIDSDGNVLSKHAIDNVVANAMMMKDMVMSAQTIAYKDYSVTKKVDQYALADYKNQLSLKNAAIKHKYNLEEAAVKNILKEGETYRKFLIDRGYINPLSGNPYHVNPKTQTMPILPGGGMAVGDPADMAAMLKLQLSGGTIPQEDFKFYAENGLRYKKGKNGKNRIVESAGPVTYIDNESNVNPITGETLHPALEAGAPSKPFAGKLGEGFLKHLDFMNPNVDKNIQELIELGLNDDIDAGELKVGFDKMIQPAKNMVNNSLAIVAEKQGNIVKSRLNILFNEASFSMGKSYPFALDGLIGLGNIIKENIEDPTIKNELIRNGSYDLLKNFPNATNLENANSEFFKTLSEKDLAEDIMLAVGSRKLFDIFVNNQGQQLVQQYDNTDFIDKDALNLISTEEAQELRKRYNSSVLKPLSEEELDALKKYDVYSTQLTVDNGFRSLGLNSPIPGLKDLNNKDLVEIGLVNTMLKSAENSKRNYNNLMLNSAKTMGQTFQNENANFVEKIIAENVAKLNDDGWVGLTPLPDIYNKAAEKASLPGGESFLDMLKNTMSYNPSMMRTFSSTIPDLEKEYMEGGKPFSDNAIKNMLWSSELPIDKAPPRNLNRESLWNNTDLKLLEGELGRFLSDVGIDKELLKNSDYATFVALLKHPSTQVIRNNDNTINIKSPYISGNVNQKYSLNDIEMNIGFENMFDEIEDKAGKVRSEYLNKAQNSKNLKNVLMFPNINLNQDQSGNFNYAVPSISNIVVQSGKHTQELRLTNELLDDISESFITLADDKSITQGDKDFLEMIKTDLQNPISKYNDDNPMFIYSIKPSVFSEGLSEVTIELHPKSQLNYLKEKGLSTYSSKEQKWINHISPKQTYYIKDSKSEIIRNVQPDPYRNLVGLTDGESYVDDIFWNEFGGKTEYRRNGKDIDLITTFKYKDIETGKFRELVKKEKYPLQGTDWKTIFEMTYQDIIQTHIENTDIDQFLPRITDLNYYNGNQ